MFSTDNGKAAVDHSFMPVLKTGFVKKSSLF